MRVASLLCLHAAPILMSAKFVPAPQVELVGARPAMGQVEAAPRSTAAK